MAISVPRRLDLSGGGGLAVLVARSLAFSAPTVAVHGGSPGNICDLDVPTSSGAGS